MKSRTHSFKCALVMLLQLDKSSRLRSLAVVRTVADNFVVLDLLALVSGMRTEGIGEHDHLIVT